jgi:hypothetical protein
MSSFDAEKRKSRRGKGFTQAGATCGLSGTVLGRTDAHSLKMTDRHIVRVTQEGNTTVDVLAVARTYPESKSC